MSKQLLLPESTTELRLKNHSLWVKSVGIGQVEKENIYGRGAKPSFLMGYDPVRPDVDEIVSITSIYGMCMYDINGKIVAPQVLYLRRPAINHRKELFEMSKYYDCAIEEENTDNMDKLRQRMADAREKLKNKDLCLFDIKPLSADINEKILDYLTRVDRFKFDLLK